MLNKPNLQDAIAIANQNSVNRQITDLQHQRMETMRIAEEQGIAIDVHRVLIDPTDQDLAALDLGGIYAFLVGEELLFAIRGRQCLMTISPCSTEDKGHYHVNLDIAHRRIFPVEACEGWDHGRYYFQIQAAVSECLLWLHAKNQLPPSSCP